MLILRFLIFSLIFFLISNCSATTGTALLGPVLTGAKSGSIYQASISYGSNIVINNYKKEFREDKEILKVLDKKIITTPTTLVTVKIDKIEISNVIEPEPLP